MNLGIDLGTTYSCAAYVDRNGVPRIIGGERHRKTTPSAVMTDGERAWVGAEAIKRKRTSIYPVRELFKRDMGRPAEIPSHLQERAEREGLEVQPYEAGGFRFGAEGMSALVLCELKRQAMSHLDLSEKQGPGSDPVLSAVITVPAYFGDAARQATELAGEAAGLHVLGLINEPTAAALAYGVDQKSESRAMVFDFGGGTIDITVLEVDSTGDVRVLSSGGHQRLGGTEVDELILQYLEGRFEARLGRALSDESAAEVLNMAVDVKHRLSEAPEVSVKIRVPEGELDLTLYRSRAGSNGAPSDAFFLEERLTDILKQCRVLCQMVLRNAGASHTWGERRTMEWSDLDRILLVGGSSKIPVVKRSLEEWSGGVGVQLGQGSFHPNTAVAVGAALYAQRRDRIRDVLSKSVGVKVVGENGVEFIDHILHKNAPLPAEEERTYPAARNAILEVYEGESTSPDECPYRGGLTLDNWSGDVTIRLSASSAGMLAATADYPPDGLREIPIRSELFEYYGERVGRLKEKIASIQINPSAQVAVP